MPQSLALRSKIRIKWHNWRLQFAFGPRYRLRKELQKLLEHSLPGLEYRLRHRYLPELCRRTLAQETNIVSLAHEDPWIRQCTFATLLMRLARHCLEDNQTLDENFSSLRRQCGLALDQSTCTALLENHLRETATGYLSYLSDLRALSRRMDIDALRERCDEARYHNFVLIELAASAFTHLWTRALSISPPTQEQVQHRAQNARPLFDLVQLFFEIPRESTRLKISQAIATLSQEPAITKLDPLALRSFIDVIEDPDAHPWVRRNLLRVLYLQNPTLGMERTRAFLQRPPETPPFSFLCRSLVLEDLGHLCEQEPDALALVLGHLEPQDPSEHVRIRLAETLSRVTVRDTEIIAALERRVCLHRSDRPLESSPKVRARSLFAIAEKLRGSLQHAPSPYHQQVIALSTQALASALQDEQDPWVVAQVCKQLQSVMDDAIQHDKVATLQCALKDWAIALRYRLQDNATAKSMQDEVANTLELICIAHQPISRQFLLSLQAKLSTLPPGSRTKVPTPKDLNLDAKGRVLAYLSRNDWGLYAQPRAGHLILQRGEVWRTRLWRILHEFRTPSPNKRKGFVHSRARYYRGILRAHPGRLDEATQTVVPGERVSLAQERGWGRYLPGVDDLLDLPLPWASRVTRIFSGLGVSTIHHPVSMLQRWINWFRLSLQYAKLSELRQNALRSQDSSSRRAYTEQLRESFGIQIEFCPHHCEILELENKVPSRITQLFSEPAPIQTPGRKPPYRQAASLMPLGGLNFDPGVWFQEHAHYFFSDRGNDQNSLSIFLTGLLCIFLFEGFRRRRAIRLARSKIPLSVGGWGTRGKSGTERLKAAMFHGLGYRVFSKTTGCEAMLIHSVAEGPQSEIFVFRPYGKATIWEQADLLKLSAKLNVDVFLWECMALNPTYVSILQHGWMKDDVATITNAYPDHEDIQGPAGMNVAQVISTFIPRKALAISSEINFHPLMRDRAKAHQSEYRHVPEDEDAWVGDDFLQLFPYQEHPRNIALVTNLGERLHIEPDLAIYNMAKHVVPDLGVLKTYGDMRVRGRVVRFINGCSANERAGFVNNWQRTGCNELCPDKNPERVIATVVNNRADRVSRSELFGRLLVNDAPADKHILIGTNLGGLKGYIDQSVEAYLDALELIPNDRGIDSESVLARFERAIARFRCPQSIPDGCVTRLRIYGRGVGMEVPAPKAEHLKRMLASMVQDIGTRPLSLGEIQKKIQSDGKLKHAVCEAYAPTPDEVSSAPPECLDPASPSEIWEHWSDQLARFLCVHDLRIRLQSLLNANPGPMANAFKRDFSDRFRELYAETLHIVQDPEIRGDALIDRCASLFPPGVDLTLLGTQNIKGTGLDFVYRWVAFDHVQQNIRVLESKNPQARGQALSALQAFADHGVLDLGLMRHQLPEIRPQNDEQALQIEQLQQKTRFLYRQARAQMSSNAAPTKRGPTVLFLNWIEGWFEFLDGARRFHQSRSLSRDLVHQRVSHARATMEMREVYARSKGGWLAKWWNKL